MKNLETKSRKEEVTRNAFKKLEGLHLPSLLQKVCVHCNRCIVADLSCDCEACSLDAPGVVTPDTAPDISEPN